MSTTLVNREISQLPRRPWWRLHLLPIVVAAGVTASWWAAMSQQRMAFSPVEWKSEFGWPCTAFDRDETGMFASFASTPPSRPTKWRPWALGIDIAVILLLTTGTTAAVERWLRAPQRWQFSIAALFRLTTAFVVVVIVLRDEWRWLYHWFGFDAVLEVKGIETNALILGLTRPMATWAIPLLAVGLLCTTMVVCELLGAIGRWLYSHARKTRAVLTAAMVLAVSARTFAADDSASIEVTIQGSMVCNGACIPDPKKADHVRVLFAIDGTPEIKAEVEKLMKELYPERGLDADAAQKVIERFDARLKFFLSPDSPALPPKKGNDHYCMPAEAVAVTGTVAEKDGRKWIIARKIEPAKLKYPEAMLAADKPFATPDREPLLLKINDPLTLKCVLIPPGKFLMGTPYWMWPYFQEEYPHLVTLTKPYYLSEIPITEELFAAVMGSDAPAVKEPRRPVRDSSFADVGKFCELLSQKTGRKVRLPSDAEWEYAARVGTSNPAFQEKYKSQDSSGNEGFKTVLPVKSKQPNAWGLYDMASCWWEITGDKGMYNVRRAEEDPRHPPQQPEKAGSQRNGRGLRKEGWSLVTHEFITEKGYAGQKFRIVVEDEGTGTADREKLPPPGSDR